MSFRVGTRGGASGNTGGVDVDAAISNASRVIDVAHASERLALTPSEGWVARQADNKTAYKYTQNSWKSVGIYEMAASTPPLPSIRDASTASNDAPVGELAIREALDWQADFNLGLGTKRTGGQISFVSGNGREISVSQAIFHKWDAATGRPATSQTFNAQSPLTFSYMMSDGTVPALDVAVVPDASNATVVTNTQWENQGVITGVGLNREYVHRVFVNPEDQTAVVLLAQVEYNTPSEAFAKFAGENATIPPALAAYQYIGAVIVGVNSNNYGLSNDCGVSMASEFGAEGISTGGLVVEGAEMASSDFTDPVAGAISKRVSANLLQEREVIISKTTPLATDNKPIEGQVRRVTSATTLDLTDVGANTDQNFYIELAPNVDLTVAGITDPISHTGPNPEIIHLRSSGVAGEVIRIGGGPANVFHGSVADEAGLAAIVGRMGDTALNATNGLVYLAYQTPTNDQTSWVPLGAPVDAPVPYQNNPLTWQNATSGFQNTQ